MYTHTHTHVHTEAHRCMHTRWPSSPLTELPGTSIQTAERRLIPRPVATGYRPKAQGAHLTPLSSSAFSPQPSPPHPHAPHTWHGPTLPGTKVTPRAHRPDRPPALTRVFLVAGVNHRDGFGRQCPKHRICFLEQRHPPLEALTSGHLGLILPDLPPAGNSLRLRPLSPWSMAPGGVLLPSWSFLPSSFSLFPPFLSPYFSLAPFFCSPGLAPPVPSSPVTDTGRCFGEDRGG